MTDRRLLLGLLLAATAFWSWLAFGVHTMPVIGGESDNYLDRATDALRGNLQSDGFHAVGLPLLIATVASAGLEVFTAGRLIAIGSGMLLVACAFLLARCFVSRPAALLTAIAVGASEYVLVGAVQACSDVPAAACGALALLCWTRAVPPGGAKAGRLWLGGFALGLAVSIRVPSFAFAPAFLPLLLAVSWRERLRRTAWTTFGGLLGLLPHLLTSWLNPGPKLQNFSQIVWKYRFYTDDEAFLAYLQNPEPIPWQQLPGWLLQGCGDLGEFLWRGLGAPWSGGGGPLAIAVSVSMTAAMTVPLLRRERATSVLAIAAWSYTLALCLLSIPKTRLTIPTVVPALVLLVASVARPERRMRSAAPFCCAAFCAGAALIAIPRHLGTFERAHPRSDLQAIRDLVAAHGPWLSIATRAITLDRYVDCFFTGYPIVLVPTIAPTEYWQRVLADEKAYAADFLVVGRASWPDEYEKLRAVPPPEGYRLVHDDDVLVYAKVDTAPWCDETTAVVDGEALEIEVRLAAGFDAKTLVGVGVLMRGGTGAWNRLTLVPQPDGAFRLRLPGGRALVQQPTTIVAAMLQRDGTVRRGKSIEVGGAATQATGR